MKTINEIKKFMNKLEKRNNQSITFMLESDGSGMFCDFWSEKPIISFWNIKELNKILNNKSELT